MVNLHPMSHFIMFFSNPLSLCHSLKNDKLRYDTHVVTSHVSKMMELESFGTDNIANPDAYIAY